MPVSVAASHLAEEQRKSSLQKKKTTTPTSLNIMIITLGVDDAVHFQAQVTLCDNC